MAKILCFGELLLRLPPADGGEWLKHNTMPVFVGGAELNVATALANWQVPVKYCTALPDNVISKDITNYLNQKNIDTSPVIYSGERIGLYYLKEGADMKSAENVFDRKYSSFSTLMPGIINWDKVLQDVSWFHFSTIAPAVSAEAAAVCLEAVKAASAKGIRISIDLNYRSLLWKYGKAPVEIIPALLQYCTLVMGNIWAAHQLLGAPLQQLLIAQNSQASFLLHATETAAWIFSHFDACSFVANTFRFHGKGDEIFYYASLNSRETQAVSPQFYTAQVVDKVGSGDCFMAGLIYGLHHNFDHDDVIGFAAAAAFGKLQEPGDATRNSVDQVRQILQQAATPK